MRRLGKEEIEKRDKLGDDLKSIIETQLETHQLWEIDECVRFLFDLSYGEK